MKIKWKKQHYIITKEQKREKLAEKCSRNVYKETMIGVRQQKVI